MDCSAGARKSGGKNFDSRGIERDALNTDLLAICGERKVLLEWMKWKLG